MNSMLNTSIQQISSKQALVQVENQYLLKEPSIKRYLENRCSYDEIFKGYRFDLSEVSFLKAKINLQISGKQKSKKISEIPSFVKEAFSEINNKLKVKNSKGEVISEILYGNEQIANDLGLSQQHISDAVKMAFEMRGRVILADDPGLNACRTAVNIAYAYDYKIPFLIICSTTQRQKWKAILKQQFNLKDKEIQIIYKDDTLFDFNKDAIIVTYEQASKRQRELRTIKVALVDDAHYLRNIKFVSERELMEYLCLRKRVVLLSNSCVIQSTEDLYPLLRVIRPDCFYDLKAFQDRYVKNEKQWLELHCLLKHTGLIRRTRSMFSDIQNDQQFVNFGFVTVETEKVNTSLIKNLLFNAHRMGRNAQQIYSQCYSYSLDAKIRGCLQFIDKQLQQKPDDKIVIFGYHQKAFEHLSSHLQEKNIPFINIEKKMTFAEKENLLEQLDDETRVVLMSFTNLQEVELSKFSTAIILEFSQKPHLIDQAIGSLYSLHQQNDQVEVFLLEGIDTLDKFLKGKFLKWLDMKNKILDGKKIDYDLNLQDIVVLENNGSNRERQNQSVDIDFDQSNFMQSSVQKRQKQSTEKKKRSRKLSTDKKEIFIEKKSVEKKRKDVEEGSQDLLPPEFKVDINQSKKQFMQKARTVDQMKRQPNKLIQDYKMKDNKQSEQNQITIDDDIENINQEGCQSSLFHNKSNDIIMKKDQNNKVQIEESVYFHQGFISIHDEIENLSKNNYDGYEQDDDKEGGGEEDDDINEDFGQRKNKNNFLDEINCDFDMPEIDNNEVDSMAFGYDETPINRFQSQRSESHVSFIKQMISKISEDTQIMADEEDFQDQINIHNFQEKNKILPLKEKQLTQNTPYFKLQAETNKDDLDYVMDELEFELDYDDNEGEQIESADQNEKSIQIEKNIQEKEQLIKPSIIKLQGNQLKNSLPQQIIIEDNDQSSNDSDKMLVFKGQKQKQNEEKQLLSKQSYCKRLFEDDFSSPFGTLSKESVMTKCSTNHFPNENSTKKSDQKSIFDKIILDIDENTKGNNKLTFSKNNNDLEFEEMISMKGQNAIGFDSHNIFTNKQQNQNKTSQLKKPFKTQQIYNGDGEEQDNKISVEKTVQQKKFTGLKKRKMNNSIIVDPKSKLNRKKVKTN